MQYNKQITKLNQLKHEHEIQSKIVICAKKLLHDEAKGNSNLLDSVLKQRFEFYTCVKEKVKLLFSFDVILICFIMDFYFNFQKLTLFLIYNDFEQSIFYFY